MWRGIYFAFVATGFIPLPRAWVLAFLWMSRFKRKASHRRRLETAAPWPSALHYFFENMEPTRVARNLFRVCRNGIYPVAPGLGFGFL